MTNKVVKFPGVKVAEASPVQDQEFAPHQKTYRAKIPRLPSKHDKRRVVITDQAVARARAVSPRAHFNPFRMPNHPAQVLPPKGQQMAMDDFTNWGATCWENTGGLGGLVNGIFEEGLIFPGYANLAGEAQRPEYRKFGEIIATEMTRKWITLSSTTDAKSSNKDPEKDKVKEEKQDKKIKEITDRLDNLNARDVFRKCIELDEWFGRSHLYIDTGHTENRDELKTNLGNGRDVVSRSKMTRGGLKALRAVEPVWVYPIDYTAIDPLRADWYEPQTWFVLGKQVHHTRLLKFVGREVPDLLKPAYSFGGLSMTQMARPYVDNWLRTRQSVSDLLHAFSVFVLKGNLGESLQGDGDQLFKRAALFNDMRDNRGIMMIDKETEDFANVSASMGGLHELQAQAQEQLCSVSSIPVVKYLGSQPTGLNNSDEGAIRIFYDWIAAQQEKRMRDQLQTIIDFVQLDLYGEIDDSIVFDFEPLREMDEQEEADLREKEGRTDIAYIDAGVLAPVEVRRKVAGDPDSPYSSIDVDDVPDLGGEEMGGLDPRANHEGGKVPHPQEMEGPPGGGGAGGGGGGPSSPPTGGAGGPPKVGPSGEEHDEFPDEDVNTDPAIGSEGEEDGAAPEDPTGRAYGTSRGSPIPREPFEARAAARTGRHETLGSPAFEKAANERQEAWKRGEGPFHERVAEGGNKDYLKMRMAAKATGLMPAAEGEKIRRPGGNPDHLLMRIAAKKTGLIPGGPAIGGDEWNENDHPRANNGQFGSGGGGAKSTYSPPKSAKYAIDAKDMKEFTKNSKIKGPVYSSTSADAAKAISESGFDPDKTSNRTWQGAGLYAFQGQGGAKFGDTDLELAFNLKNPFVGTSEEMEKMIDGFKVEAPPKEFAPGVTLNIWNTDQDKLKAITQAWKDAGYDGLQHTDTGVVAAFNPKDVRVIRPGSAEDRAPLYGEDEPLHLSEVGPEDVDWNADDPFASLANVVEDEFKEHQHPRDPSGKFTAGGGAGGAAPEAPKGKKPSAGAGKKATAEALLNKGVSAKEMKERLEAFGWTPVSPKTYAKVMGVELEEYEEDGVKKWIVKGNAKTKGIGEQISEAAEHYKDGLITESEYKRKLKMLTSGQSAATAEPSAAAPENPLEAKSVMAKPAKEPKAAKEPKPKKLTKAEQKLAEKHDIFAKHDGLQDKFTAIDNTKFYNNPTKKKALAKVQAAAEAGITDPNEAAKLLDGKEINAVTKYQQKYGYYNHSNTPATGTPFEKYYASQVKSTKEAAEYKKKQEEALAQHKAKVQAKLDQLGYKSLNDVPIKKLQDLKDQGVINYLEWTEAHNHQTNLTTQEKLKKLGINKLEDASLKDLQTLYNDNTISYSAYQAAYGVVKKKAQAEYDADAKPYKDQLDMLEQKYKKDEISEKDYEKASQHVATQANKHGLVMPGYDPNTGMHGLEVKQPYQVKHGGGKVSSSHVTLQEMQAHAPAMTSKEKSSIHSYTGSSYTHINGELRKNGGKIQPGSAADHMQQYLKRATFHKDLTLYRKVGSHFADSVMNSVIPGETVLREPGFMSTSVNSHTWHGSLHFEISVKKGMNGAAINSVSKFSGEEEVLLPAGTRYLITHYDEVNKKMKLEVIQPGHIPEPDTAPKGGAAPKQYESIDPHMNWAPPPKAPKAPEPAPAQGGGILGGIKNALGFGGGNTPAPATPAPEPASANAPAPPGGNNVAKTPIKMSDMKKVGDQLGSNPGGKYKDSQGNEYYIKQGKSKTHVNNELLAGDLFKLAGVPTLDYHPVDGGDHIATKWETFDKNNVNDFTPEQKKKAQQDFAVHAWLANWDAAGLGGDNMSAKGDKVVPNDLGGALLYRAKGGEKGAAFGDVAGEWTSLRDSNKNPDNAKLFGGMSDKDLKASAMRVANISDNAIRVAVKKNGMDPALAEKLIKRKFSIAQQAGLDMSVFGGTKA